MKGQGLSLTTIVIAAIALIVLVVLVAIFTGRIGGFGEGVGATERGSYCCASVAVDGNDCSKHLEGASWEPGPTCSSGTKQIFTPLADSDAHKGDICCQTTE